MNDIQRVKDSLHTQTIELPSWAFGNSGTRFKVFAQPGVPRDPYEKIADAAEVHRVTGVAPRVSLHIPWDRVDDYGRPRQARRRPRRAHRGDQLQRLPGRRLQARLGHQPRPTHPPQGDRPPPRVRRRDGRHRVVRPQAVVLRRHQLPRPGRPRDPPGSPRRRPGRGLRPPRRRSALPARVQVLRAGVLRHRRARLGHVVHALRRARAEGDGGGRHRPPRARHEHRVHRGDAAAGRQARRLRLQLPLLRRRRPDGGLGRPVPALPDHVGGAPRRRPRPGERGVVHARPVPQHRAQDRRPDPLGHERAGGDGQGIAGRRTTRCAPPRTPATCSAPTRC